ncbi:cyclohexanecarboxylate-CoA ligase [Arthrobacter sp. UCD-GKA]|uniref:AMP-binding protein n=1 Tax=Arthrobacter sp. UCD-GKA TaxID=1913576 RepID=UPI0008DD9E77|nr:AMP-binding protein [Arthrobacter sp. UCD-GKA]OIH85235.1 cyclohexanecarboxylate-CoA ligase [Arthrobacter sp. UCD-GKA]
MTTEPKVSDRYTEQEVEQYYRDGEWLQESFYQQLLQQEQARPDKVFVFDSTTSLTFAQFREQALRLAVGFKRLGVSAGDRVVAQLPNWTEFPLVAAATSRIGAVVVPGMPIYRAGDVGYVLENSGAVVAVTASEFNGFNYVEMFHSLRDRAPGLRHIVSARPTTERDAALATPFSALLAEGSLEDLEIEAGPDSSPDDPFQIVYTSGTTSRPKGCYHTLNTVRSSAVRMARELDYTEDDIQFGPSPITHSTGLVTSVLIPLVTGASSHFMEVWNPVEAIERIREHKLTAAVTATPFLQMLMGALGTDSDAVSSLRIWVCAGAPIPASIVRKSAILLPGCKTLSLYGRSENLATTMCSATDDAGHSLDSDGRAVGLHSVKIVDALGEEVPRGEEGDIAYHGPSHMLGYWANEAETGALFTPDGYSLSGDLGRMDDQGYVRVTGRMKDIIIRGGMNISAREIEDELLENPGIANVAVVSMPDERLGEKVCAFIVPSDGEIGLGQISAYLQERGLPLQKVPERVEIVSELPTTATGKIQKHLLRAEVAAKLAASQVRS